MVDQAGKRSDKDRDKDGEGCGEDAPMPTVQLSRNKTKVHKGEGLWLMSFSDMSLILMSFFILQLSFSTPDKHKYDNLNSAIKDQQAKAGAAPQENLQTMSEKIKKIIHKKKLDNVAEVKFDVNGLQIEFKDQTLFDVGSAAPNPKNAKIVGEVLATIAKAPGEYKLVFEGHTDDLPVTSGKFRSNWDLAAARGIALLDSFKGRGVDEKRMSVLAFAHTRPKVEYAGLTGEALAKARGANRRVVIRLE